MRSVKGIRHWWRRGGLVLVTLLTAQAIIGAEGATAPFRWSSLGRPQSNWGTEAWISSLVINPLIPDELLIGLSSQPGKAFGIFKADNSGKPWVCVHEGQHFDSWSLAAAPSKPEVIYAASYAQQVIRSVDGGVNWTEISGPGQVEAIAVDPVDPLVVYAALDGGWGLTRTRTGDGGGWDSLLKGQDLYMRCVAVAAGNASLIFTAARAVNSPGERPGLYRTTDGGESWKLVFADKDVMALAISPANARTVFAGTAENGLWRSIDGGETWQKTMQGITHPPIGAIAVGSVNPQVVYAGTRGDGVFRSEDGGDSWQPMNDGLGTSWVSALAINPRDDSQVYVGTNSGVYAWRREAAAAAKGAASASAIAYVNSGNPSGMAGGVPGGVPGDTSTTSKPADAGLSTAADYDRQLEVMLQAQARERRGKIIGVILLVLVVVALLVIFLYKISKQPPSVSLTGDELLKCTRPATICGFVFTGIYAMAGLYLLTSGRGGFPRITGTWALADAGLFLTGSLLARQGRFQQARVIWLIAGWAGFPLGTVMLGFVNHMTLKIRAAEKKAQIEPPVPPGT